VRMTKQLLIVVLLAVMIIAGGARVQADDGAQVVRITASKFRFTPDHISLVKGRPATLELTSTDTTHGFLLRALRIDAAIRPGATIAISVTPGSAGTFWAICDHYCGLGHGEMKLTVEVRESVAGTKAQQVAGW
jgi:cytochrome c oxidase subunit II